MTTVIRSPDFPLTSSMRAHLTRRFLLALKRFDQRISLVEVSLEQVKGSRDAPDGVEVLVEASVHGMNPIAVSVVSYEPYSAISIAAKRTRRVVKRAIRYQDTVDHYGLRALAGIGPGRPAAESG